MLLSREALRRRYLSSKMIFLLPEILWGFWSSSSHHAMALNSSFLLFMYFLKKGLIYNDDFCLITWRGSGCSMPYPLTSWTSPPHWPPSRWGRGWRVDSWGSPSSVSDWEVSINMHWNGSCKLLNHWAHPSKATAWILKMSYKNEHLWPLSMVQIKALEFFNLVK